MGRGIRAVCLVLMACKSASDGRVDAQPAPPSPQAPPRVEISPPKRALPNAPIRNDDALAAHAEAQRRYVRKGPPLGQLRVLGDADGHDREPGFFVRVRNPSDNGALDGFHGALAELAAGKDPDGKVRVLMYGASGTASDRATGYIRAYLQRRFGDAGPGFVPLVPLSRWYRHSEVKVEASKAWKKEHAQIYKGRQDGHYGLLGASFYTTKRNQWAQVSPKDGSTSSRQTSAFDLYFLSQPGGGSFTVHVDGKPKATVATAADTLGPGYHRLDVDPGPHTIKIVTKGDGEVRVFGVTLERRDPGVVVDVLGVDGTRSANHLTWNEEVWIDNIKRRAPDLVTLSYGTNESVDEDEPIDVYRDALEAVLGRLRRTVPNAGCLVLAPGDFPLVIKGEEPQPRPRLLEIIEIQRELAPKHGCGFWDGMEFMGGTGSMARFVEADPPLARRDFLHFTGRGAARKAQALCDALMLEHDAAQIR